MVTPVRTFAGAPARREKVRRIFELFDADGDGALGRSELSALVAAVNPGVVFTADQLCSVLDAVFRSYAGAADADRLSLAGLLRSYDDGAGDVDRDFAALFPDLAPSPKPSPSPSPSPNGPLSPLASPIHEIAFDSTRAAVARLEALIKNRDGGFAKGLREIRANLDRSGAVEAASEGHVAIGRALFRARLLPDAVDCFRRAAELSPADPRAHFRLGTALSALDRPRDARRSLSAALETSSADALRWQALLPQIRVNLGVVLEREGLLLAAAEHYRAAARLCPTHYRALKLLGSALCGAGEHLRAVAALEEALLLKPDFPDALCDLGAALHAAGERDRAAQCFDRALQLDAAHADAAFNLGGVFKDMGLYGPAVEAYGRALVSRPDHWAAELNRAAVLLGAGQPAAAKKALEEAYKRTKRVELYNAILYVKKHQRRLRLREGNGVDFAVVDPSAFKTADRRTTHARCLTDALCIRDIQKITRFGRIDANLLRREMGGRERVATKAELEGILRKLLHFLNVESFQEAMKVINEKILTILDATSSGKIDLSMFFAVVAPICTGPPENRKGVAFDFLADNGGFNGRISKTDASIYLKYMRVIYFQNSQSFSDPVELGGQEEDRAKILFSEFVGIFDDADRGFGILPIVIKLEAMDNARNSWQACGVCKYRIGGLMFKEIACHFWLCSSCYSERKVPSAFRKDEYVFQEYMIDK
ncbi:putative TPR repeat-containing protein [Ananas comosus]|uniref:Putative TPR repeat-containing protein n=1 Tax=Ananas comosus TaxID=4615 RepID=A0A199V291_ANACO|nr:putative TPR repeat-containing protein [Ananas comosus]